VSKSALETHFFQILRRPKLHLKHDDVIDDFLLLLPPPCSSSFVFDNRWVVPYNPYLTMQYQCHINVEVCSSITTVKYLYKYVYKGHDRALAVVQPCRNPSFGLATKARGCKVAGVKRKEARQS
jgi:hypothetical protein